MRASCSKHIDVKFFFVKEKIAKSLIPVKHTPTTSMLVNPVKHVFLCISRTRDPCDC